MPDDRRRLERVLSLVGRIRMGDALRTGDAGSAGLGSFLVGEMGTKISLLAVETSVAVAAWCDLCVSTHSLRQAMRSRR